MMRNLILLLLTVPFLCNACSSGDNNEIIPEEPQVTFYDKDKEAIAYIDYKDDAIIYTFGGEPVAYLEPPAQIYGFNGRHLGWYEDGVLYERSGYAVGAIQGIARGGINTVVTHIEKIKGVKHIQPVKTVRENSFYQPVFLDSWSETTLTEFFMAGKK